MRHARIAFIAASLFALAASGTAQAGSIGSDWSYPDYESTVQTESYSAFYGYHTYSYYPSYTNNYYDGNYTRTYSYSSDYDYCNYDIPPPTNPVPEPSAALVFGLGALVVGSRSRRR